MDRQISLHLAPNRQFFGYSTVLYNKLLTMFNVLSEIERKGRRQLAAEKKIFDFKISGARV